MKTLLFTQLRGLQYHFDIIESQQTLINEKWKKNYILLNEKSKNNFTNHFNYGPFFGMALASGLAIAFAEELEESFLGEKLGGCLVLI
jgi:hypothetical protein